MAVLTRIEDPRDNLARARKRELYSFAARHGVSEITADMGADDMRDILRARNLTRIEIPPRTLGQHHGPINVEARPMPQPMPRPDQDTVAMLLKQVAELTAQIQNLQGQQKPTQQQLAQRQPTQSVQEPKKINELRAALKANGVKVLRTDTLETLKAKLNGQNAS